MDIRKWLSYKFDYIGVFNSPFVRPKFDWYFGKVAIGVPYFLPHVPGPKREPEYHPNGKQTLKSMSHDFVPKKVGFDVVDLGWKSKWSDTDYRFEWSPLISFVFFKWQVVVRPSVPDPDSYWTAWLYYNYNTDRTKSQRERIQQCRKEFPQRWTNVGSGVTYDSYDKILKEEYR